MGKIAFLFPGQGAQTVGMGQELAEAYPAYRRRFAEASELLGFDLLRLCLEGPEADLQETVNTQPAILTMSIACLDLLQAHGLEPAAVAGLSLGEYSALVAAGTLSFEAALPLVRQRGLFMQEAVPVGVGGMVAILGLATEQVEALCQQESRPGSAAWPANYNCPGQLVVAGHLDALERVAAGAKALGAAKVVKLPVSAPFHCPLLAPAGERLREVLVGVELQAARVPFYPNVAAEPTENPIEIRELLIAQVSSPIRFEASIRAMLAAGIDTFIEVGPGRSLSGFVRKIDRQAKAYPFSTAEGLTKLLESLGRVC